MDNSTLRASLLIAGIAAALANAVPTPMDAVYFSLQERLKEKQANKEITVKQYWIREGLAYYTFNPSWYLLLTFITYNLKGDIRSKLAWGLGIVGVGAVVGAILSNIQREKKKIQTQLT